LSAKEIRMMNRKLLASLVLVLVLFAAPAAFAQPVEAAASNSSLSPLVGLLTILLLSLGAAAGTLAFGAMATAYQPLREELDSISSFADETPRKALAAGIVGFIVAGLLTLLLLKVAKPLGLLALLLLAVALAKGFVSRVLSAGRVIGRGWENSARFPFADALLGTLFFELAFLCPVAGQAFVALAVVQGFGACTLRLAAHSTTPSAPLPPAFEPPLPPAPPAAAGTSGD
jgi:hypothetical protein